VGAPLAVEAELNVPHGEVLQVTDHVTPAFALSLLTVAVRVAVADAARVVGTGDAKATEIAGGVGGVLELPPQAVRRNAREVREARLNS
jgi:3-deoxy-D-manno-octulosonate 8-phosphate phosphatase KdsC-like HAD superfamily phosphatase